MSRKEYVRKWREKNPDKVAAANRRWRHKRVNLYYGHRLKLFQLLGGKCVGHDGRGCPYNCDDPVVMVFDHIRGDGTIREGRGRGATGLVWKYVKMGEAARDILQNLCGNCHLRKTRLNKEHRHGRSVNGVVAELPLFEVPR